MSRDEFESYTSGELAPPLNKGNCGCNQVWCGEGDDYWKEQSCRNLSKAADCVVWWGRWILKAIVLSKFEQDSKLCGVGDDYWKEQSFRNFDKAANCVVWCRATITKHSHNRRCPRWSRRWRAWRSWSTSRRRWRRASTSSSDKSLSEWWCAEGDVYKNSCDVDISTRALIGWCSETDDC